ncbi:hypothetical protein B0H14DRAFT_17733 [Mycena olivaceomarginata]|nr:hypothetical protein B0H14DRAFT_17733 [Mycena olivaceomarginata]
MASRRRAEYTTTLRHLDAPRDCHSPLLWYLYGNGRTRPANRLSSFRVLGRMPSAAVSCSSSGLEILECLSAIHREGLLHGDFAERNVLLHEGDVRIIDFDQTESGHDCRCKMNFRPGEKLPDIEDFGCDQLWEVCRSYLRIWDTTTGV